ncbi:phage terminase, small subunit, putative, P27 family [Paenibacillus sp. UNC496MF]|uniref:phage terminase small subunit P27 family n=1 Tax=Paenibacillus sp. UNC496MF TaxID=1502753 RepID=UPI0008E3C840|nr:phage terminase small subunit P27 family [Paenibacillus sp. UNC496MF]SFJ44004.1 phage terminase, small subunit, putative, P27 family [Paenibacillus sp. UNC496MF]
MNQIVRFDHMRVGQKGGGKHWTKEEVQSREDAAKVFERKKKRNLKIPSWLDDNARKIWRKIVRDMEEFEIFDAVDEDVLAAYCDAVAKHQAMNELIDTLGFTAEGKGGQEIISPHVTMAQNYARLILQFAEKLGITAGARARLAKRMAEGGKDNNDDLFG